MSKQEEISGGTAVKAGETSQESRKVTQAVNPFEDRDRMFDRLFHPGSLWPMRRGFPSWDELKTPFEGKLPRVDVIDRDAEIIVKAELPGVRKEDIEVSVTDNTITIKGSTRREEKEEKGEYYRCEIFRGAFARTVALPENVDSGKAKASFKDGVLELVMPKLQKTQRRRIAID